MAHTYLTASFFGAFGGVVVEYSVYALIPKQVGGYLRMSKFPRGSEWRRWDLHLHTASSYDYLYKDDDADELLVSALRANDVVAVAITDHFIIDKDRINHLRELAPDIVFFPGVELRTDKGDTNIHVILILSQDTALNELVESFNVFKREKGKEITNDDRVYWDYNDILKFAEQHSALISIHAGRKTNGVDDRITNALEHNQAVKEEYAKTVHIFEMGQPRDIEEYHQKVFPTIGKRPLILCSDNHNPNEYDPEDRLWIKADVSFNGLKQIVFEPTERVCISAIKPEEKPDYFVIDRVEISDDAFQSEPIYFNDKLNCIIGGKSTGKSILLHNLALTLDKEQAEKKDETSQTRTKKDLQLSVFWADGKSEKDYPQGERRIVYIPQTYLNKLCDVEAEKTEIDKIIQEVVFQRDIHAKAIHDGVALNVKNAKQENSKLILDLIAVFKESNEITAQIREIGDKNGIAAEREKLVKEKERLTIESTLTAEEIAEYEKAMLQIKTLSAEISTIDNETEALIAISSLVEPKEFTYRFSDTTRSFIDEIQRRLIVNIDIEWHNEKERLIENNAEMKTKKSEALANARKVEECLREKVLSNKAIADLSERINTESAKITKIKSLENERRDKEITVSALIDKIANSNEVFESLHKEFADAVNGNSALETKDLQFSVEVPFRRKAFLQRLSEIFNRNSVTYKEVIKPDDASFERHSKSVIMNIAKKTLSGELQIKQGSSIENALRDIVDDWLEVKYDVSMGDDSIDVMSPGKKALVLLKLLIELAESKYPILIDQPEDDLDNRSIYDELIEFIKTRKKERQIIIVTHNANIVVGADAEEVIIANQDGQNAKNKEKRFEYRSGSIENNTAILLPDGLTEDGILNSIGIQQHICSILEGGERAFELRKQKYQI